MNKTPALPRYANDSCPESLNKAVIVSVPVRVVLSARGSTVTSLHFPHVG